MVTRPIVQKVKSTLATEQTKPGSYLVFSYTYTPIESYSPFVCLFVFLVMLLLVVRNTVTILRDTGATGSLLINPKGKPLEL